MHNDETNRDDDDDDSGDDSKNDKSTNRHDWLVGQVALYIFVLFPLSMAFDNIADRAYSGPLTSMLVSDILIILHPLVYFNVGIVNEKSLWITNRWQIASRYLQGWFVVDLLAALPLDWIAWAYSGGARGTTLWRIPKLLFLHVIWPGCSIGGIIKPKNRTRMMCILIVAPLHVGACIWAALGNVEDSWNKVMLTAKP